MDEATTKAAKHERSRRVILGFIKDTFDPSNKQLFMVLDEIVLDALEDILFAGAEVSGASFADILRKVKDRERERVRHDDEFGRRFRDESTAGPDGLAPARCA